MDRTFLSGSGLWNDAANWSPAGVPEAGDTLTVSAGMAVISDEVIDAETLLLGSDDASQPAVLSITGGTLGGDFVQQSTSTSGNAMLSLSGAVTLAGTLSETAQNGTMLIDGRLDGAVAADTVLTGELLVSNGEHVTIQGGTFDDTGTINVDGGTLTIGTGTVLQANATIVLANHGTLVLDGPAPKGLTIQFADGSGTLMIGAGQYFASKVTGFQNGDSIVLTNSLATKSVYADGQVTLLTGSGDGSDGAEVAHFALSGADKLLNTDLFLSQDGSGNSVLFYSVTRNWNGSTGDWYDPSNWTDKSGASGCPGTGDTAIISSGTAQIASLSMNTLNNETIVISGGKAGLQVEDGQLGSGLTISARSDDTSSDPTSPSLTLNGQSVLDGTIESTGSDVDLLLKIGAASDGTAGTLTVNSDGTMAVDKEALIDLHTGELLNNGLIQDAGKFTVGTAATLDGSGTVVVDDGELQVQGVVGSAMHIDLSGGPNENDPDWVDSKLVINNTSTFGGVIDNFGGSDKIDLTNVRATSASFDQASNALSLLDASGTAVAMLKLSGSYTSDDFHLAKHGSIGTEITESSDTDALGNVSYTTLPVPVLVAADGTMTLQQILTAAFGSNVASTYGQAVISAESPADMSWAAYWNLASPTVSSWSVDGAAVPADTYRTVAAADWTGVSLTAGTAIQSTATVLLPTSWSGGIVSGYTAYQIQTVDPTLFTAPTAPPTAAGVVAAAETLDNTYSGTPNSEDCYNIAAQVAAAAGATFGGSMYSTNPTDNAASGFWRIAYAAPQDGTAVSNWSSLVQAGDIMRIGWAGGDSPDDDSPHSFTILSGLHDGNITVFDNGYQPDGVSDPNGEYQIGISEENYWDQTDPAAITIFRIDANSEFLITGTSLQDSGATDGEILQGNGWDDLFIPDEMDDRVIFGSSTDILADVGSNLDGVTLDNVQNGDSIDVTDMDAGTATVGYDAVNGRLTLVSGSETVTITTARGLTGQFTLAADGGSAQLDGGTLGSIYDLLYADNGEGTRMVFTATAPATPVLAVTTGAGATIDPDALVLSGSGDAGTTILISSGGSVVGNTTVSYANQWSFTLSSALAKDSTSFSVTETNGEGVSSTAAILTATRGSDGVSLQAASASGSVVTSTFDTAGAITGWSVQGTASADGTRTVQRFGANGTLVDTTLMNAQGWTLEERGAMITTVFGHDASGTVTATAATDTSSQPATVTDGTDGAAVVTVADSHTVVRLLDENNTVVAHNGDTISGGSGRDTISAGAGSVSVAGGSGALQFIGSGASTVLGGSGSATISGGAGGIYVGGSGGKNVIHGAGHSSLWGGGDGDLLVGGNGDLLGAADGNGTLVGGQNNVLIDKNGTTAFTGGGATVYGAENGSDVVVGTGSFTMVGRGAQTTLFGGTGSGVSWAGTSHLVDVAGTGTGTLVAGTGESILWINDIAGKQTVMAVDGASGGSVDVMGFRAGTDSFAANGYTANATQTVSNGSLTLTLSDHTSITFVDVSSLG